MLTNMSHLRNLQTIIMLQILMNHYNYILFGKSNFIKFRILTQSHGLDKLH